MSGGESPIRPGQGAVPRSVSADEIQDWIVAYLAGQLQVSADRIDVAAPFDTFALDSATAIGMTGDLEQWLGRQVDPTIVYDYPTIEELAEYLAQGE